MKPRGLSLAEVLVVGGLMSLLGTIVVAIYALGLRAQTQADLSTAAYRNGLLALEHLLRELRGSQLIQPALGAESATAGFRTPVIQNGLVQVDGTGLPLWSGPCTLGLASNGDLIRLDSAGVARKLASLGRGSLRFRHDQARLVQIEITAEARDSRTSSRSQLDFTMYLANQGP